MDCENCKKKQTPEAVTRYAYEETVARMDLANRRSWILCIILAALLMASWIGFFFYESQFETVTKSNTQEVEQVADGGDNHLNFVGGDAYGDTTEG